MASEVEKNKKIAAEFYDLIINKKDYESAKKFVGNRYKQHNPLVADGPEGLKAFIDFLKTNYPQAKSEIKKIIAEGDLVVLHVLSVRTTELKRAIIEIFRLENGKIEEHWDVIQEIPKTSANPNGMF
ncbi:MAG TPA: ester cyclase [Syntrophorhabdaceae bacterium]|nr:ester cyclase [Syntrophorhabdaceae bacterium]